MTSGAPNGVVRCVVFDIDDTLYLERDYVRSGFAAVGRWLEAHRDVHGFGESAWEAFVRGVRGNTFDTCLRQLGVEPVPELVGALIEQYRHHRPDIALLADAKACLESVAARHWAIAALTDGPLPSQRAKAEALGLGTWARPIVYTAELGDGLGKPHPAGFQLIERRVGANGLRCVYVADNPHKDFAGPRKLGWQTIRIRRAGGLHADAPDHGDIDVSMPDLTHLVEVLAKERC